ncbi:recombination-associated protein RdgC [Stenoxybacter acetivorans]|uniref:recombination-associated protein RdgC n=1 Tax=Stenoxybacter acetivorans TaxID=422441 RepID=UPI00055F2F83|nr:recombination-associated protein RdgC [Stenoxybacter acetivorans]
MWFKQLSIYPLNKETLPALAVITDKLAKAAFTPCLGLDWDSSGFAPSAPFGSEMVFAAQNTWRIALKKEEKVLPSAVIRDVLDDRIANIQAAEARSLGRKEKQELKEQITDDLLPRAFTKSSRIEAIIDTDNGLLLINQANANKAETLLTQLRDALGGLDARLPDTKQSPGSVMTHWLFHGAAAGGFELDSDCELKGLGDSAATVRMSKQDLLAEEVVNHIKSGKTVTQLGLCWQERVRFVLTDTWTLKRIQFLDVLQEEAANHGDDPESLLFASQILMTETLSGLIAELAVHLGGWSE